MEKTITANFCVDRKLYNFTSVLQLSTITLKANKIKRKNYYSGTGYVKFKQQEIKGYEFDWIMNLSASRVYVNATFGDDPKANFTFRIIKHLLGKYDHRLRLISVNGKEVSFRDFTNLHWPKHAESFKDDKYTDRDIIGFINYIKEAYNKFALGSVESNSKRGNEDDYKDKTSIQLETERTEKEKSLLENLLKSEADRTITMYLYKIKREVDGKHMRDKGTASHKTYEDTLDNAVCMEIFNHNDEEFFRADGQWLNTIYHSENSYDTTSRTYFSGSELELQIHTSKRITYVYHYKISRYN